MCIFCVKINRICSNENKRRPLSCSSNISAVTIYYAGAQFNCYYMSQKCDLTSYEKSTIVSGFGKGKTTIKISKILLSGRGMIRVNRTLSYVKGEVVQNPCLTSRELLNVLAGKTYRKLPGACRLLKQAANNVKPVTMPLRMLFISGRE